MSKIYCVSDIHGCLEELERALFLIEPRFKEDDAKLVLLGDYINGGPDNIGVMETVISLEKKYGRDKVIALMGNHEDAAILEYEAGSEEIPSEYISWMRTLRLYHREGNTIFVHAGIDEDAGDLWETMTPDFVFTGKYPQNTGPFPGGQKIVAGHTSVMSLTGDGSFRDIYYDGESHYFLDCDTPGTHTLLILMADTDKGRYKRLL